MSATITEDEIRRKYEALSPLMDERLRRCWAGIEADVIGEGGIAMVERATGMSRTTIRAGRDELRSGVADDDVVQVRRPGGGRPRLEEVNPGLITDLVSLVEPVPRGDPESPLRRTSKFTRKLAAELTERGMPISPKKVGELLFLMGTDCRSSRRCAKAPNIRIETRSSSSSTIASRRTKRGAGR